MPSTVTTAELQAAPFTRGTKVRLVDDIPGYPAGSEGKIAVANGFEWIRYWIRFPDGSAVGHVDHKSVVRRKDYDAYLIAREREAIEAEKAAEDAEKAAADAAEAGDGGADAGGGGSVVVNGVTVPQRLLDMSAAARVRLGA
ncbi:MAG: hypothetical protein GWN79_02300 [Actinobacteria bacterium]|nr:hypothetical protein [Actinomycetota bacterium]NIS34649.1 hypothetical protein [Actinomycetota bacterium]NIT97913.1 hypothetical protein [Actinomycetota bacterium]NIU17990.1 hypothetical protein [Actinomycetota bacterium]NIU69409.1 hypothetical protein [Actinomycetota bacterium]